MGQLEAEKDKLKSTNIDEKNFWEIIFLFLIVFLFLFCCVKEDSTSKKPSNSSFGSLKDFKIECTQDEYNFIHKNIEDFFLAYFRDHPEIIHSLSPRDFEEFIAYLYMRKGFDVSITSATKDGGKDIIAKYLMPTGETVVYYIECKRYSPKNPIGVTVVKELSGTMVNEPVHIGVIITTSRFTKDAQDLIQAKKYPIELKDMNDILKLLV